MMPNWLPLFLSLINFFFFLGGERVKITLISMNERDSCVRVCEWLKKPAWHTHSHTHASTSAGRLCNSFLFADRNRRVQAGQQQRSLCLFICFLFLFLSFTMLPNFGILIQKSVLVFYLIRWTHVCGAFYLISLFLFALCFCFVSLFVSGPQLNELKSWSIYDTASVTPFQFDFFLATALIAGGSRLMPHATCLMPCAWCLMPYG